MKFNADYVSETTKQLLNFSDNKENYSDFSIDLPDGFTEPPVLEITKCMYDEGSLEMKDNIARHCLIGKKVIVLCDNKPVGSFIMNNMTDKWDAFEVLKKYPLVLNLIFEVCQSYILKKSTPPLRDMKKQEPEA
jgi:hypothetical protein